jgi:SAM-dependent methyltransferase
MRPVDSFDAYARFYDMDYAGFDDDVQMVQQFAQRSGSPLLELGCGTGRLLLPLARTGFEVTGVDASEAMLAIAHQKLAIAGLASQATLSQQRIQELALDRRFNLAFSAVNSFLHVIDMEEQLAALLRIRQHLNPGGLLLLDLFNPDLGRLLDARGQVVLDKVLVDPETGDRVLKYRAQSVDEGQQTIHTTLILDAVDREGRVRRTLFAHSLRYLFRGELELLLSQAGFALEAVYGSYDLEPFDGNSDKMIAIARVPA